MSNDLTQPSDLLFQEIRQLIDTAKKHTAVVINAQITLLFYNRKLKPLVAIDLKLGNFHPEYKSQMELYLRWLAKYDQEPDEQPPLGNYLMCR